MENLVKHLIWLLSLYPGAERIEAIRRLTDYYCPTCGKESPCQCDS